MALSEFALIERFFRRLGARRDDVALGVGDDCALLAPAAGQRLAVSIDTLVEGVHFLPDVDPAALGHKALAVGLSDLAAMGAEPAWATLALTLPEVDSAWLQGFADGFGALARRFGLALVGGDTTAGPRSVSVQVHGLVPAALALRRDGARPGDRLFVSGTLGDAGLVLRQRLAGAVPEAGLAARLDRPEPRVALGLALRGIASAAIDLSDGLASDLTQLLRRSGVGATVDLNELPRSAPVAASGDWSLPLSSGDDYELCFCVPSERIADLTKGMAALDVPVQAIGRIEAGQGAHWRLPDGGELHPESGWEHFKR